MDEDESSRSGGPSLGQRGPEVAVAALLAIIAALVIADSLRVGNDWADDGPRAGYFPFYVGLALLGASLWTLLRQLLHWRDEGPTFATHAQLRMVAAVLVPLVVYVIAVVTLGLYVASALLIAFFMWRHGPASWRGGSGLAIIAAVAVGVPLAFFVVFERWFLVPLPKGPLERLLGL